jgi:hypothetical protein
MNTIRRYLPLVYLLAAFCLLMAVVMLPSMNAKALPEYSAQTGEPCASCHISPSGGGPRGPRGQGWVAQGKPGTVPNLVDALSELGVTLDVDPGYYLAEPGPPSPAEPLQSGQNPLQDINDWVRSYDGN